MNVQSQPTPEIIANPLRDTTFHATPASSPRWYHRRLPGYEPTPLHDVPELAERFGVGRVLVKDEATRLGLPAFKILGASWATFRTVSEKLGHEPTDWTTIEDLAEAFRPLRPLTLATATDGNHGRALARIASLLGFSARIWVPHNTVSSRIKAIESEGAVVRVSTGGYEQAVREAAEVAGDRTLVVSDTSWPGYETVPGWVIDGYTTIVEEVDDQVAALGGGLVDMAFVPAGVGAFAAAVAGHFRQEKLGNKTILVCVEPSDAACCMKSAVAGELVTLQDPQLSIMAGLNCGTPSQIAWPLVSKSYDLFVTVNDAQALEAMRLSAQNDIVSGESAAAPLAALSLMQERGQLRNASDKTILLFSTEGVTDPVFYEREVKAVIEAMPD